MLPTKKKQRAGIEAEFSSIDLGDARLKKRALQLLAALGMDPTVAISAAVSSEAESEAAYRLLRNERVSLPSLLAPHVKETVQRASATKGRVLVLIDKTSFTFGGEAERDGLDWVGIDRQGYDACFALAVTPDRRPLGVLAVDPLEAGTGRSGAEIWAHTADGACAHFPPGAAVVVIDREADAYELLAFLVETGRDFIIRVAADRLVKEQPDSAPELLKAVAKRAPVRLDRQIKLSRRPGSKKPPDARRKHPPRDEREATLTVRACPITLPRPKKLSRSLPPSLTVNLVHVVEEHPPAGAAPVEWLLFSSLPIDTAAAVAEIVDGYRARWLIEEYFKALKTGCNYEGRRFESLHTLLNILGFLIPIAWQLLALRAIARSDENAPASSVLDADTIHVLRSLSVRVKLEKAPTGAKAMAAIAGLGGHLKHNGSPGWIVLWRGAERLFGAVEGYRLAKAEM